MLTPKDINTKTFKETTFKRGYDMDQVDDFLDEAQTTISILSGVAGITSHMIKSWTPTHEMIERAAEYLYENNHAEKWSAAVDQAQQTENYDVIYMHRDIARNMLTAAMGA